MEPWKDDTLLRAWIRDELTAAHFDALSPRYRSAAAALLWHSRCNPQSRASALWSVCLTSQSRGWFVSGDGCRIVQRPAPRDGAGVAGEVMEAGDAVLALALLILYGRNLARGAVDAFGLNDRTAGYALSFVPVSL